MLSNKVNKKVILAVLSSSGLALLASCSNSTAIESLVSADPQLKNAVNKNRRQETQDRVNKIVVDKDISKSDPEVAETTSNKEVLLSQPATEDNTIPQTEITSDLVLPQEFPNFIPLYPQAELQRVKSGLTTKKGSAFWQSSDDNNTISEYYQQELKANDWAITQPFTLNEEKKRLEAIAVKNNVKITVAISKLTNNNSGLLLTYKPFLPDVAQEIEVENLPDRNTQISNSSADSGNNNIDAEGEEISTKPETTNNTDKKTQTKKAAKERFSDYDEIPEQLRKYVKDVAELGILEPYVGDDNADIARFEPNKPITRGEYARWLISANNLYHGDSPGKKIHVASSSESAAFKDINPKSPNFGAIQGLAEAGLIPSMLTNDSTKVLFQPNAPLKREDLIAWKVPLDLRQALPPASTQAIQDSWGFQDVANIDPATLKALFGDFQNGDRSNINRLFGYTILFQPKKPVTRAEAAASLWYFGFQGDGITAPEALAIRDSSQQ